MIRRAIAGVIGVAARIFFRRIEIAGADRVPDSPVIFAVNHPNALIDPLFLVCFAPRPVSFLAKAPLFRTPLIRWFVRAFDSIPVYRKQDAQAGVPVPQGNRETFAQARAVLQRGGAIAIFPEGTTHSDPRLRELKTGAARIALGAAIRVSIVPTGLYYTAKQTFRSSALAYFGTPMMVEPEPVDANGEPQSRSVERLTEQIEHALADVTLQADSHAALELIARAERIFSAGEQRDLARELELRRQFVAGYRYLSERDPARLAHLESRVARMDAEVAPDVTIDATTILQLLLLPIAIIGAAIHWPIYRLIGWMATHFSRKEDELIATIKIVGGIVFYPLFWIGLAILAGRFRAAYAVAVLIGLPLLGYIALITLETVDEMIGHLRATRHRDLERQRKALRDEILAVAAEINAMSTL
ncbi:MAG TPA: lysophospholipid acyltransferase family protein [Thermoanaerobaculia bacterium]|nr:lysophospholipid acyltransferase family protein [Thermoanaerobaculia bacterium]